MPKKSTINYTINEYIPKRLNNKVWECCNCSINRRINETEWDYQNLYHEGDEYFDYYGRN
jgi:Zn-finger protein